MTQRATLAMLAAAVLLMAGVSGAHSQTLPSATDTRRSGAEFMGSSTRAMQRDDTQNPGMLWVSEGEALWQKAEGGSNKAFRWLCIQDCAKENGPPKRAVPQFRLLGIRS